LRGLFATWFAITLLAILLLQTAPPVMVAGERELAYDSGTAGDTVSLPYVPHLWVGGDEEVNQQYQWIGNSMLAVRFTPDNSTLQMLLGVRFYVTGDFESFNVWVFDSNRNFLTYGRGPSAPGSQLVSRVYRWAVTPVSIGWVSLNVIDVAYPIFLPDDFYVAIEFTVAQRPRLGVDIIGPNSARSWIAQNQTANGWTAYSTYAKQHGLPDGNLMIRAVVSPIYNLINGTTTTTGTAQEFPFAIVSSATVTIFAVAAVGIWQVGKRRRTK
jgi:hypothetical protein